MFLLKVAKTIPCCGRDTVLLFLNQFLCCGVTYLCCPQGDNIERKKNYVNQTLKRILFSSASTTTKMTRRTIRFEDLGEPIQKLLMQLGGDGYTEEDMKLMEFVSVKDMTKIYNDLNERKKAETIWKELKSELQNRQLTELKQVQDAELSKEEAKAKRKQIKNLEKMIREEEEKEAALEAERKQKKRDRKERRERERREREEAEEAAAAAAAAAEEEPAEDEDPAEAKARRKRERRKAKEEALAAEEARLAAEAEDEAEEQKLLSEKKARKEERRKRREEASELQAETERLEQQATEIEHKRAEKASRNLKKEWLDHVKDHPLEFGDDVCFIDLMNYRSKYKNYKNEITNRMTMLLSKSALTTRLNHHQRNS